MTWRDRRKECPFVQVRPTAKADILKRMILISFCIVLGASYPEFWDVIESHVLSRWYRAVLAVTTEVSSRLQLGRRTVLPKWIIVCVEVSNFVVLLLSRSIFTQQQKRYMLKYFLQKEKEVRIIKVFPQFKTKKRSMNLSLFYFHK